MTSDSIEEKKKTEFSQTGTTEKISVSFDMLVSAKGAKTTSRTKITEASMSSKWWNYLCIISNGQNLPPCLILNNKINTSCGGQLGLWSLYPLLSCIHVMLHGQRDFAHIVESTNQLMLNREISLDSLGKLWKTKPSFSWGKKRKSERHGRRGKSELWSFSRIWYMLLTKIDIGPRVKETRTLVL